jgi:hypothetical protein
MATSGEFPVNKDFDLIFCNGRAYRAPAIYELIERLGSLPDALDRSISISRKLGYDFRDQKDSRSHDCSYHCKHGDAIRRRMREGYLAVANLPQLCQYVPGDDGPWWLSFSCLDDTFENKKLEVVTRKNPCVIDTGILLALAEEGTMDAWLTDTDIDPKKFPFFRDIIDDIEDTRKAAELYKATVLERQAKVPV